jgi:hypothetical protein
MDSFVFVDTSLLRWAGGVHTSLSRKLTLELSESAARNAPKLAPMFSTAVGGVDSLLEK